MRPSCTTRICLLQRFSRNGVALRLHNRHIGRTAVRRYELKIQLDVLTRAVCLHVGLVVGVLHAFAEVQIAVCGREIALGLSELLEALDIVVDVETE